MPAPPSPTSFLATRRRGRLGDDPIFALNAEATARKARGEAVINASLGALLDDSGKLVVMPTAAQAVREVPAVEWAAYAPIAGTPPFLAAVIADVFPTRAALREASVAVASPGGTGALRHAIATFLEPRQRILTTSFYWGPYATLADENERDIDTFPMFDARGRFNVAALDEALGCHLNAQGRALVILNDPCHNPTGYSMTGQDWAGVAEVLSRHAASGPVSVVLDGAYCAYGPAGDLERPVAALENLAGRLLVMVAWTASKAFTHYGLRVGALIALVPDRAQRDEVGAALTFACGGTWSNCNRGGLVAVTRLLTDPALSMRVKAERASLMELLAARTEAFHRHARLAGLHYPAHEGGFFLTVLTPRAREAGEDLRKRGIFVVPVDGGLRLGICAVPVKQIPTLVEHLAATLH